MNRLKTAERTGTIAQTATEQCGMHYSVDFTAIRQHVECKL
jgi:hypothetical protein